MARCAMGEGGREGERECVWVRNNAIIVMLTFRGSPFDPSYVRT